MGLGDALAIGLMECSNELVARMDSDDISLPDRFKKQLKIFEKYDFIDVCGCNVAEFDKDENKIYGYRKVPEFHDEIVKFAKFRSPINHPSIMFKKSSVLLAGNYQKAIFMEDYFLWVRMILRGYKFYNINQVLVKMRAGQAQIYRRQGLKYAISEFKIQFIFYKMGFLNLYEFIRNVILKFSVRVMPNCIIRRIYEILRR
ncbi:glycosyltransferase [Campylobacter portucalensis]|uniref:glycosyltransferase n=1 Tax=Campylobacter portucalensis TaxID=2608384 RepID=UPI001E5575AE|nr:glycosyltransferase [Campylobacter portucalensis]